MHKIAILLPLLLIGASPAADEPVPVNSPMAAKLISPTPGCKTMQVAQSSDGRVFRRLGELPPADAYQAVYRLGADGCIDPLLVSDRIRQNSRR